jgi:hypothetical protein
MDVAPIWRWEWLGSILVRRLVVVSGIWLDLRVRISVGLDAVPLRFVDVPEQLWLVLETIDLVAVVEYGSGSCSRAPQLRNTSRAGQRSRNDHYRTR